MPGRHSVSRARVSAGVTYGKPPTARLRTALRSRAAFALVLAAVLSGCLPSVRANVSVADFESAFPTITQLGLRSYEFRRYNEGEPICEAITYRRGAFATITDGTCGTFKDVGVVTQVAFDQGATIDLTTLKSALAGNHVDFQEYVFIEPGPDGSVGPGSYFATDGCVNYYYSPDWTALPSGFPGEEVSKGIDPNWYKTDICP